MVIPSKGFYFLYFFHPVPFWCLEKREVSSICSSCLFPIVDYNVWTKGRPFSRRIEMKERLTVQKALERLKKQEQQFTVLFKHGTLEVEFYAPKGKDDQTPHTKDEVYVIAKGKGTFFQGGDTKPFEEGDVLFVPAGEEHRFENFSDDFATWVFFFGPEGGE